MDMNQITVSIIAFAGDSQSYSMEAIKNAREKKFKESEECLKKAKDAALESHKVHTELLAKSAADEVVVNFLMVHASNHMSVANTMITMAELFIEILKEMEVK